MMDTARRVQVIDSHTGGEPTRVVLAGGPELGAGSLAERRVIFESDGAGFRLALTKEPRGSDILVGALIVPPTDASCAAGVIFFNDVGTLGMCGHGTIGLVATLAHLGQIGAGAHRIETPVGVVTAVLRETGEVSFENVRSYRHAQAVRVAVAGFGEVVGDVAWGGNWFFLTGGHGEDLLLKNVARLTEFAGRIRAALREAGIAGADGAEIDHVELFAPSRTPGIGSRNFVLCPGGAYDRSPCGTGTSAKLACLFADEKLREGETWRQESITGSVFEGRVRAVADGVIPTIAGRAFITAEATLVMCADDPLRYF